MAPPTPQAVGRQSGSRGACATLSTAMIPDAEQLRREAISFATATAAIDNAGASRVEQWFAVRGHFAKFDFVDF